LNYTELEDALVEFIYQNTYELKRFRWSEVDSSLVAPNVFSGFVGRNEVGERDVTGIKRYPAVIINVQKGGPSDTPWESELVSASVVIGTIDFNKDQQGYRDCLLLVERIGDRIREQSVLRQRFPLRMPINWDINRTYTSGQNSFPYFFGDMELIFELPVMESQFMVTAYTGDHLRGTYDERQKPDETERPEPSTHSHRS
jgi:hypothetical protein